MCLMCSLCTCKLLLLCRLCTPHVGGTALRDCWNDGYMYNTYCSCVSFGTGQVFSCLLGGVWASPGGADKSSLHALLHGFSLFFGTCLPLVNTGMGSNRGTSRNLSTNLGYLYRPNNRSYRCIHDYHKSKQCFNSRTDQVPSFPCT
ncbi:hypothetical protein BO82DRAFT_37729 [Aspergillus uvarum CBS 121591]|uniref:Uncharacterized protein n=1 Tax=Aspergillus uvarum CBS 121591 TaxID=1448315 RepID=A0A319CIJ1_9EURO|nr:hypothetical protein BO82DRAFT_37729 [Aspergillus uvarum CBS 121591]PYH83621.1 hypothetical protein BO82DRAFT_37729 [Aspergillus uvarum CBS 121591]